MEAGWSETIMGFAGGLLQSVAVGTGLLLDV